jgi:hypothetical protein
VNHTSVFIELISPTSFFCLPAHLNRFSCCDLDGDGALSPEEMRHFYKNQILRVTNLVSYYNGVHFASPYFQNSSTLSMSFLSALDD